MGREPLVPESLKRGPFTVAEAHREGLARWHLEGASWKRLSRGTYLWAGVPETPMSRLVAAGRRLPDQAAFSGLTAAWLHGLDVPLCDPIEVTIPREVGVSSRAGIRVRRSPLPESDVVRMRGLRATSMVRTLVDVCSRLPITEAVVIADAALHARRVTIGQLLAIRRLKRVAGLAEPEAESPMESRLRMILVLGGLPRPKAQVSIHDSGGRFVGRPDLYYEQARLGIEFDGAVHRSTLVRDDRRQNNLLRAGVRLLRFTSADVLQNPASIVMQVRAVLASR